MRNQQYVLGALMIAAAMTASAHAVVIGALSNFQDLTLQGWDGASPNITPTGGPLGTGDAYLSITSDGGSGPNSRAAMFNGNSDWVGDYLAAGVTAVEADFLNLGNVPLSMRAVLFRGAGSRYSSKLPTILPVDGLWHHMIFAVDSGSLRQVAGSDPYNTLITGVTSLMFRHQVSDTDFGGTPIATSLGIDNIHILPAPGAGAGLLAVAGLACARRRR